MLRRGRVGGGQRSHNRLYTSSAHIPYSFDSNAAPSVKLRTQGIRTTEFSREGTPFASYALLLVLACEQPVSHSDSTEPSCHLCHLSPPNTVASPNMKLPGIGMHVQKSLSFVNSREEAKKSCLQAVVAPSAGDGLRLSSLSYASICTLRGSHHMRLTCSQRLEMQESRSGKRCRLPQYRPRIALAVGSYKLATAPHTHGEGRRNFVVCQDVVALDFRRPMSHDPGPECDVQNLMSPVKPPLTLSLTSPMP